MHQRTKEAARHIDVVLRALDILDCFQDDAALSLKEIIDRTGLTRSRVMRLIGTLESRGYITENREQRIYYPGIKLSILGKSFDMNHQIESIIRPKLKQLALDTGESATLYVLDGLERVALVREEGSHAIRYSIREGQRHSIHRGGASSKILLAFGPSDLLKNVKSIASARSEKMIKQINAIRKNGYAISKGENIPDAHAIAAPVFDAERNLVGALGIAGPSLRMNDTQIRKRVKAVVDSAHYISERFGNRDAVKM
jgi:DNA-binding IclR family transcriptional regulator